MAFPGLVNYVPAVAYHFCLNLLVAFSQPGNGLIVEPCTVSHNKLPQGFCHVFSESTCLLKLQGSCSIANETKEW